MSISGSVKSISDLSISARDRRGQGHLTSTGMPIGGQHEGGCVSQICRVRIQTNPEKKETYLKFCLLFFFRHPLSPKHQLKRQIRQEYWETLKIQFALNTVKPELTTTSEKQSPVYNDHQLRSQ